MLLEQQQFFVRERVALMKLTDTYDILDPQSQTQIGLAREEPPAWAKFLRILVSKRLMPTTVNVYENENMPPVLSIRRGVDFWSATVKVVGANGEEYGTLKSKVFSFGGAFRVFDKFGSEVAEVKGDWKGWNFRFLASDGRELGTVTKKWAGIGKELFTSADNYMISLAGYGGSNPALAALLLAAGLAVDMIYKEKN